MSTINVRTRTAVAALLLVGGSIVALAANSTATTRPNACVGALVHAQQLRDFWDAADDRGLTKAQTAERTLELSVAAKADQTCNLPSTTTTSSTTTTTAAPTTTTTAAPTTTTTTTTTTMPPAIGFPDASNTGPSGTLTPSGTISTSAHGQVIQNLDVTGEIRVQHNNVVIRNVRIRSEGGHAIYTLGNTGLLIEDCELDGQGQNAEPAIAEHNYTMRRCEIRGYGEGPRINGNVTLEDNYIHGFANFVSQGAHQDGIQGLSGDNITIRHNTVLIEPDGSNGAIFFSDYGGNNILIERNLVGGGNWAIQLDPKYTNVRVLNNRFTTTIPYHEKGGYFGAMSLAPHVVASGNVWHDGPNAGQPAT